MPTAAQKSPQPRPSRRPRSPARQWTCSIEAIFRRRKKELAAGKRLLWEGRIDTLRLSPGHIQGFIYTRDSRFVLVNIRLRQEPGEESFCVRAEQLQIACSEKRHPGFSRYAAATLLGVARELRAGQAARKRLFPGP